MQTINILLTRFSDHLSLLVFHLTGRGYTHASIALQEDDGCYYSFTGNGFVLETTEKFRRRGVKHSVCYKIQVSEDTYRQIKAGIEYFQSQTTHWKYTKVGLFFALLGIPFVKEDHFFCSQFVAHLLHTSKAVPLKKRANLYLPNHFVAELSQCNALVRVDHHII